MSMITFGGATSFSHGKHLLKASPKQGTIPLIHKDLEFSQATQELHQGLLHLFCDNVLPAVHKNMQKGEGLVSNTAYAFNMGSAYMGVKYQQCIYSWPPAKGVATNDQVKIVFSGLQSIGELSPQEPSGLQGFFNKLTGKKPVDQLILPTVNDGAYNIWATGIAFRHNGSEWRYNKGGMTDNRSSNDEEFAVYGMELIKKQHNSGQFNSYMHTRLLGDDTKHRAAECLLNHLDAMTNAVNKNRLKLESYRY